MKSLLCFGDQKELCYVGQVREAVPIPGLGPLTHGGGIGGTHRNLLQPWQIWKGFIPPQLQILGFSTERGVPAASHGVTCCQVRKTLLLLRYINNSYREVLAWFDCPKPVPRSPCTELHPAHLYAKAQGQLLMPPRSCLCRLR